MQQLVLQEQVREMIAGRKVTAALFYTFNFDPRFFENYVMPLLVPGKTFRDEIIHNKILWRNCLKEGIIPPITVYCDFFAKDNTTAPSLGYHIHCLRIPAAPGYICNFHPKNIFLLLEHEGENSLLMITGSGNLTTGGWCENFEGFSIKEFKKNNPFSGTAEPNALQDIIIENARLKPADTGLSKAEITIQGFLNYVDFDGDHYFSSMRQSFKNFLEQQVFSRDNISEVEIISPYFSEDTKLLNYLKEEKKISLIKCLIPTTRQHEIQLAKKTFLCLQQNGLVWCEWEKYFQNNQWENRNNETRNLHAKIYRFYGLHKTYTIVGSINFTNPGWKHYNSRQNEANIEAAWLYTENKNSSNLLIPKPINVDDYRFIDKDNQDEASGIFFGRDMPEIDFVLNWRNATLNVQLRTHAKDCTFHNILKGTPLTKGTCQLHLLPNDIRQLTRNTLIEISQSTADGTYETFSYYVQQEDIAAKPLDFHLNAIQIIKYWEMLGDEYAQDLMTRSLAELLTNEYGVVDESRLHQYTLLNEMATHFNGLIKLEKYIFSKSGNDLSRVLQYYLLSENVDTLSFYLKDLEERLMQNKILKSFYWMIIQILQTNFYDRALQQKIISRSEEHKLLRKELHNKKRELSKNSDKLVVDIEMTDQQKHWIIRQLAENYA